MVPERILIQFREFPMPSGKYSGYHDLLYRNKDYTTEASYLKSILDKYAPDARRLLELGCGTGGYAAALVREGYAVHGVDISEEMLSFAWERARKESDLSFSHADIRQFRCAQPFDAIVSFFRVFSFQTKTEDLFAALSCCRDNLRENGFLIFDFWNGPGVLHAKPSVKVKRFENDSLRVTRIEEPDLYPEKNSVCLDYDIFIEDRILDKVSRSVEKHCLRYFFLPEIDVLLEKSGFERITALPWLKNEGQPGLDDWYGLVVARKK